MTDVQDQLHMLCIYALILPPRRLSRLHDRLIDLDRRPTPTLKGWSRSIKSP
jgi:hypothetical protein